MTLALYFFMFASLRILYIIEQRDSERLSRELEIQRIAWELQTRKLVYNEKMKEESE